MSSRRFVSQSAVIAAAVFSCPGIASANFIQTPIYGGDSGNIDGPSSNKAGGVDLSGTVLYAVDALNTGEVVRGTTFTPVGSTSGVTFAAGAYSFVDPYNGTLYAGTSTTTTTNFVAPTYAPTSSSNNTNLDAAMQGVMYATQHFTLSFSNLNPADYYELQVLVQEVADTSPGHTERDFAISLPNGDSAYIESPVSEKGGNKVSTRPTIILLESPA
jgi:hypothetical protein